MPGCPRVALRGEALVAQPGDIGDDVVRPAADGCAAASDGVEERRRRGDLLEAVEDRGQQRGERGMVAGRRCAATAAR